jgi:predicted AAA+ superfamily ATPase
LNPYYDSNFKKLTKRPKMYFLDTGLACYLSKINSEQTLELSSFSGQFFETFVVNEIIKSYANDGKNTSMYFYWFRNNSREEIDFIIDINNKLYPIEIKKNISPESKNSMQYFPILSRSKKEVAEGGIICMTNELKFKDSKNMLIPLKTI